MAKTKTVSLFLTNRVATFISPYPKEDIRPHVSFHPPGYRFMPAFKMGAWDGRISMLKRDKLPAGLFRALRSEIADDLGIKFAIHHRRTKIPFRDVSDGIQSDRPYQNECVQKMVDAAEWGGGLVIGATGSGKTYTAAMFFSRLPGTACFIVDELTLMEQARTELSTALGEPVGIVGNQIFDPQRITVATAQTLHRHRDDPKFTPWSSQLMVTLIDELHVMMNRRSFETVRDIEPAAVYGLTATLELQKKDVRLKAYSLAGPVLFEYPLEKGVEEGYLAPHVVTQILYRNPCGMTKKPAEDYVNEIVMNEERNTIVSQLVHEVHARGKYTVVLVERLKHLKKLSQLFRDIPHRVASGQKEVDERISIKEKFEEGRIRLILANKVFQKGINIPQIDVIVDAAATRSKNTAVQKLGRGLRLCEGKKGLLYFDIADVGGSNLWDKNRYHKSAKSRARAFKAAGAPIHKVEIFDELAQGWAYDVVEKAEKRLEKRVSE